MDTQNWRPRAEDFLKLGGRNLDCQNLRFMLEISYEGCLGLSPVISAQFTLQVCVTTWNREKFTKTRYFWISRSFKVIDVGTPGKLVSSACYDKQQVCAYL